LIDRYLIPYILYLMPNVIASDKRSVTYLENLTVHDWMAEEAAARNTDVSTILREATSAYFAQWASGTAAPSQFAARAAAKVARRAVRQANIGSSPGPQCAHPSIRLDCKPLAGSAAARPEAASLTDPWREKTGDWSKTSNRFSEPLAGRGVN